MGSKMIGQEGLICLQDYRQVPTGMQRIQGKTSPPLVLNIERATRANRDWRRVMHTGRYSQLVLMSIPSGEEVGPEVHPQTDQFIRVESGTGKAVIDGREYKLKDGVSLSVDAGSKHTLINPSSSKNPLKIYTIYSPPHHPRGQVQRTKQGEIPVFARLRGDGSGQSAKPLLLGALAIGVLGALSVASLLRS